MEVQVEWECMVSEEKEPENLKVESKGVDP